MAVESQNEEGTKDRQNRLARALRAPGARDISRHNINRRAPKGGEKGTNAPRLLILAVLLVGLDGFVVVGGEALLGETSEHILLTALLEVFHVAD